MRLRTSKQWLLAVVVLALAAMACGGGGAATATSAPTSAPTDVPAPTNTPRPTATAEPAVELGDEYRSDEGGFAFQEVPDWEVADLGGFVILSPADADPESGPALALVGGLVDEATTLDEAYEQAAAEITSGAELSEPEAIEVDGFPAYVAEVSGEREGEPAAGRIVVALYSEHQLFALVGYASPEVWEDGVNEIFEAVLASVTLYEAEDESATATEIRQWASAADASTEFSSEGWSAGRATGEPDVTECGDNSQAWASAFSTGEDWLEVYFDTPVVPSEVNIYQTYNPSQVTLVELITTDGEYIEVYSGEPEAMDECPYVLSVPMVADSVVEGVRISVDQSVLGLGWNEIDAVELVGFAGGEAGGGGGGTTQPDGEVYVEATYRYVDHFGYTHIVGTVYNNSDEVVTGMELTLTLVDDNGDTMLEDSNGDPTDSRTFSPLLYTLVPGQASPFDYWIYSDAEAEEHSVTLTDYSTSRSYDTAELSAENVELYVASDGDLFLSGEIVNLSDTYAQINTLAGAVVDANGAVLAADWSSSLARRLAPAGDPDGLDRTPFIVTLDGPAADAEAWALYWDAAEASAPDAGDLSVTLTEAHFDEFDSLHIVGVVTNNGDELMSVTVVTGLYAEDGTVLDAASSSVPLYVQPGGSVPFQAEFFPSVNTNDDQAARVARYTAQIDPYWTFETSTEVVALETTDDEAEDLGDGAWRFTGSLVNDTDEVLTSGTVVVAVYDSSDTLVGVQYAGVYPASGTIAPGGSETYEVTVYLDPADEGEAYSYITLGQGFVE